MLYQLETAYKDENGYKDVVKIGYSFENFEGSRIYAYETHNPSFKLLGEVPGNKEDEGRLHWLFRDDRIKNEWFLDSAEIRYIFPRYKFKDWRMIKSFFHLSRYCPVVEVWAQVLRVKKEEWLNFLWKLSKSLDQLGSYGELKQNPYTIWFGPGAHDYMPTREVLREALKKTDDKNSEIILDWVSDVKTINYPGLFDSGFLVSVYNEYMTPCYPGLLRAYCEFLDKFPERTDIRDQFYDPTYKLAYEKLGRKECEKLDYNYGKICSALYDWEK